MLIRKNLNGEEFLEKGSFFINQKKLQGANSHKKESFPKRGRAKIGSFFNEWSELRTKSSLVRKSKKEEDNRLLLNPRKKKAYLRSPSKQFTLRDLSKGPRGRVHIENPAENPVRVPQLCSK